MGNKRKKFCCASIVTFFMSFLGFVFSNTFASSVVDEFSVTVPESCSLTSSVGITHTAEIENGVYANNIGETTINAFCNDAEGFSIYAVGYSGGEFGNNTMKPSTLNDTHAIATGLATSGDTSNWAMKLTSLSENFTLANDFGSYHLVPNDFIKVASYPSNTTTTAGVNIKSTYAAYISQAQPADSYTGKVKFIVLHPSSKLPTTNISDLTNMQDFKSLSSDEKASVNMSMQNNTTYELVDVRDNKTYQVAKMKDGNIWMAENLDLGRTTFSDLTSENSNLAETVTATTFNSWKVTCFNCSSGGGQFNPIDGTDETSGIPYGTRYDFHALTGGTFDRSDYSLEGKNPEYDICPAGWRLPTAKTYENLYSYYNSAELFRAPIVNGGAAYALTSYDEGTPGSSSSWYWTSTTIGSYNANFISVGQSSVNLHYSAGRQHGATARCIAKKPDHALTISYNAGVASIIINDTIVPDGTILNIEPDTELKIGIELKPRYGFDKWTANSGTIETPTFQYTHFTMGRSDATLSASTTYVEIEMQNLNSSSCTSTPSKVYDNRDGHVYTIQRLLDGNCWMADNLQLGNTTLTTDLTSSNTNLSSTITSSVFNNWKRDENYSDSYNGVYILKSGGDYSTGTPYGVIYNYYATSAATGSNAEYDICPAGWRLPIGGEYGEYKALGNLYNPVDLLVSPLSENGTSFTNNTAYWTSTRSGNSGMSAARFDNTSYFTYTPSTSYSFYNNNSIRCTLKHPTHSLTISYGTGVSSISLNAKIIADGTTIDVEDNISFPIKITVDQKYALDTWSATSGTIDAPTLSQTYFTTGSSDATLSASATYVDTEMQNLDSSSCTTTPSMVYDNRDGRVYTIQRLLDGKCWMVENLDLGRTALTTDLTNSNTNLSSTIPSSTFNSWKRTSGSQTYNNGIFIPLDGLDSVNHQPFATLYNYYATSAGTISGSENNVNSQYDICPAGWRLPTGNKSGDLFNLYSKYGSENLMRAPLSENGPAFTMSGYFYYTNPYSGSSGYYWSSSKASATEMLILELGEDAPKKQSRQNGISIRCVMKNPAHTLTVSYGEGISGVTIDGDIVANGATLSIEEGMGVDIGMIPEARYTIDSWSATSGTIRNANSQYTSFSIGSSDATLSVTSSYVDTEMQNYSSSSCTTTPNKVYDNRDGRVYIIQKLKGGKCWMMENLDLGHTPLTTDLTSSNTNLSTTITSSTFNSWKTTSYWANDYTSGEYISLDYADAVNYMPFGTLYNYYAASAGTISGSSSFSTAIYDICPAGWRLPSAGSGSELTILYNNYNSLKLMTDTVFENGANFVLTGRYDNFSKLFMKDEKANYWSRNPYNNGIMRVLEISKLSSTSAYIDATYSYSYNYYGNPIRCVLK